MSSAEGLHAELQAVDAESSHSQSTAPERPEVAHTGSVHTSIKQKASHVRTAPAARPAVRHSTQVQQEPGKRGAVDGATAVHLRDSSPAQGQHT